MTAVMVRGKAPTQTDRVLAALEQACLEGCGINETAFALPSVIDGGKPIRRVAARVHDLRKLGYRIRTVREANLTATYYLVGAPS